MVPTCLLVRLTLFFFLATLNGQQFHYIQVESLKFYLKYPQKVCVAIFIWFVCTGTLGGFCNNQKTLMS